jgi:hydroxyacyl-ACP dehydratase HTD2-like protein with hotdog domain
VPANKKSKSSPYTKGHNILNGLFKGNLSKRKKLYSDKQVFLRIKLLAFRKITFKQTIQNIVSFRVAAGFALLVCRHAKLIRQLSFTLLLLFNLSLILIQVSHS